MCVDSVCIHNIHTYVCLLFGIPGHKREALAGPRIGDSGGGCPFATEVGILSYVYVSECMRMIGCVHGRVYE